MNDWYKHYLSGGHLTKDQRIFLSFYTEAEFTALVPMGLWLNKRTKTTVAESYEIVLNWINTGEWEYKDKVVSEKIIKYKI